MSEIDKDIKTRIDMVGEPVGAVALDYPDVAQAEDDLSDVPPGKYGFYTSDPDEFEQKVAMIEEALDKVDAGVDDPREWILVDDFMAMMRKEHPWAQWGQAPLRPFDANEIYSRLQRFPTK